MARDEKKPAVLPLANIAVLAAFVGGLAMYLSPLTSARPSVEAAHNGDGWGDQDVDARLWQDPLEVASKHEDDVISQAGNAGRFDPAEESARSVEAVSYRLAGAEGAPHGLCRPSARASRILAVMVRGGPYEEAVEGRLRVRRAVVEGLSASGFAPEDYQHVGYLRLEWPPSEPGETVQEYQLCGGVGHAETATVPGHELLVPFEWYDRAAASSTTSRAGTSPAPSHILVLWLRDDAFQQKPLSRLAGLLSQLRPSPTGCVERPLVYVSVIGPSTSNGLGAMLAEETNEYTAKGLDGVEMLSAFASASEHELLEQAGVNDADGASAADVLGHRLSHFTLRRTIPTDDRVMTRLVEELRLRQVWEHGIKGHIAVLAELDSMYGRSLPRTFMGALQHSLAATYELRGANVAESVETYYYLQGIDGKVPTDRKREKSAQAASDQHPEIRPHEATEGTDQSDYLRRLAERLRHQDRDLRQRGEGGIVAVGLLGADVFDKIMILRALRKALPDAVFFTNNIDARLGHPAEWDATHNLVIASPYGLRLAVPGSPAEYAPFRDSYETSAFFATLAAIGSDPPTEQPRLYEIGLAGPYALDGEEDGDLRSWIAPHWFLLLVALLASAALLCCMRGLRGTDGRWFERPSWKDFFKEPPLFLFGTLLVVAAMLVLADCFSGAGGEPVLLFDGISIWPSEAVRLLAGLLGVVFLRKSMIEVEENDEQLRRDFHLSLPGNASPADEPGDLQTVTYLWAWYVRNGRWGDRLRRILPRAVLYFVFGLSLIVVLGMPRAPSRGDLSWWADLLITRVFTGPVTIFLLFFVIDAMRLNGKFIAQLMDAKRWPWAAVKVYGPTANADDEIETCVAQQLAIDLIAQRTAVIGRLIYYPFILVALMMLSRLSYFDDWDLPVGLLLIFGLNGAGAVFAALTLRRSAEKARQKALGTLRRVLFTASADGDTPQNASRRAAAERAIEEIETVRTGAFGPFSDNPVVRALLLPGSAGLVALAQYLPSMGR